MMNSSILPIGNVEYVTFELLSEDEIQKSSNVTILNSEQFKANKPVVGGIYDTGMGTTSTSYNCSTCLKDSANCLGHDGQLILNYPVKNNIMDVEIKKWLKIICHECGQIIISQNDIAREKIGNRFDLLVKIATTTKTNIKCYYCGFLQPGITKTKESGLFPKLKYYDMDQETKTNELRKINKMEDVYPHRMYEIFSRVTKQTLDFLGVSESNAPINLVPKIIPIPPVTMRPNMRGFVGGKFNNNDISLILHTLVAKNLAIPNLPDFNNSSYLTNIRALNDMYNLYTKGKSDGTNKDAQSVSLSSEIRTKKGIPRQNLMGKTTMGVGRSVISCDPRCGLDEIKVPWLFVTNLTIGVKVTIYNIDELRKFYLNGTNYPGATTLIKNGQSYMINVKNPPRLEIGDILYRHLIPGDCVLINRQPSLLYSSISGVRIKITGDKSINTIRFNPLICTLFGADFDGDQMQIYPLHSSLAINEGLSTSNIKNWVTSIKSSSPDCGQILDSTYGLYKMTKSDVQIDRFKAMRLCSYCNFIPTIPNKKILTGKELISLVLPDINYSKKTEFYKKDYLPYYNYSSDDEKVIINNGQLVAGVFDKATIGQGKIGSLYHQIALKYDSQEALNVIYNMQQIALSYLSYSGFTFGISDIITNKELDNDILNINKQILLNAKILTDKIIRGELIPPLGKTTQQFAEEQYISILRTMDVYLDAILKNIDLNNNSLFNMVNPGVKGGMVNMFNIMAGIGQILINDKRIKENFAYKRASIYGTRFDNDPVYRGFIQNGYSVGLFIEEFVTLAMNARSDIVTKALSTSITGSENRTSIKNLESVNINNARLVVMGNRIIQLCYGEDSFDPRPLRSVEIPFIFMSDAEFHEKYHYKTKLGKNVQDVYDDYFNKLSEYRQSYYKSYDNIQKLSRYETMKNFMNTPVEINLLVNDYKTLYDKNKSKEKNNATLAKNAIECINIINNFLDNIGYINFNQMYEKRKRPIPEFIKKSYVNMVGLIRTYLNGYYLESIDFDINIIKFIIDEIKIKLTNALIDAGTPLGILSAQSISEPLTQYMLDAQHRQGGGTSKSGVKRFEAVLQLKDVKKSPKNTMILELKGEYAKNEKLANIIAKKIESMKLSIFIAKTQVIFGSYGDISHPDLKDDKSLFDTYERYHVSIPKPTDLLPWCIRFELKLLMLVDKGITVDEIALALKKLMPGIFVVHSAASNKNVVLRVYFESIIFKKKTKITMDKIIELAGRLSNMTIHGIDGIIDAKVIKLNRYKIGRVSEGDKPEDEGRPILINNLYGLETNGTNLFGMLAVPEINHYTMNSNNVIETYEMFGIEAARQKILYQLREVIPSLVVGIRHYTMYADVMTSIGVPTSIDKTGIKMREFENILLRISTSHPITDLKDAVNYNCINKLEGFSAPLMLGLAPVFGTTYNKVFVNEKFVEQNSTKLDDLFD